MFAQAPVKKNVPGTCSRARVARIEATPAASPPASKVSATTRRLVGIRLHSLPSSHEGNPGGAGCADDVLAVVLGIEVGSVIDPDDCDGFVGVLAVVT